MQEGTIVELKEPKNSRNKAPVFLAIRLLAAIWAIYIGAYYSEWPGWLSGVLLLFSTGYILLSFYKPIWKPEYVQVGFDAATVVCSSLGFFQKRVLVFQLYIGIICLVALDNLYSFTHKRTAKREKLHRWTNIGFYTTGCFLVFLTILTTVQRHIIYPGVFINKTPPYPIPESIELEPDHISFTTSGGIKLQGWLLKPTPAAEQRLAQSHPNMPRVTLWFLYGNGNTYVDYLDSLIPSFQKAYPNLQIFTHAYRGFLGGRDDRAYEDGIKKDIDAAAAFLSQRSDVDKARIFAYGHSLGGALVIHVLKNHPRLLTAGIISNSFTSLPEVLSHFYLGILSPLITEHWDNYKALQEASSSQSLPPLLFISSRQDEQVPPDHMDKLFNLVAESSEHKVSRVDLPSGKHNSYGDSELVFSKIRDFLSSVFLHKSLLKNK